MPLTQFCQVPNSVTWSLSVMVCSHCFQVSSPASLCAPAVLQMSSSWNWARHHGVDPKESHSPATRFRPATSCAGPVSVGF